MKDPKRSEAARLGWERHKRDRGRERELQREAFSLSLEGKNAREIADLQDISIEKARERRYRGSYFVSVEELIDAVIAGEIWVTR